MKLKNALTLLPILALVSCSGGNGGSAGTATSGDITSVDSQFIDAPVEGLNFSSDSFSGITGTNGSFQCTLGEEVSFYLGSNLLLGKASCGKKIMLENLSTKAHKAAIGATLQSFGVSNGKIVIPTVVRAANLGALDFSTSSDSDIATFISNVNNDHSLSLTAINKADALVHIQQSEEQYKIDGDFLDALKELAHFTSADGNTIDPDPKRFDRTTNVRIAKNMDNDCAVGFYISLYRTYLAEGQNAPRDRFYVLAYTPQTTATDPNDPAQQEYFNGEDGEEVTSDVFSTQFNVTMTGSIYKGNLSMYLDLKEKKLKGKMKYSVDGVACSATINEALE